MKEVLQQLANLQYIDSRIDEIRQLRGDLPEEILDIETEISRLEAKIQLLEKEQTDLIVEKDKLHLDISSSLDRTKKYEEQQLTVRNNREYDALTKEIEAQRQVVENAKSRLEEIEARALSVAPELESEKKKLQDTAELLEDKRTNLEKVVKNTKEEEEQLLEKRDEFEKVIDPRYLKSYNRLRNGLTNGIAVVAMDKGAALGMALPPQTQVEVRRMNKIVIDESSGRIVVDSTFFESARNILD